MCDCHPHSSHLVAKTHSDTHIQSKRSVTHHCPSSPSQIAIVALSAATAPPSSSLQSDALCLHNPTDALSIDTLFVSFEHRQILAGRHNRSQHGPAMKILISEWLALRPSSEDPFESPLNTPNTLTCTSVTSIPHFSIPETKHKQATIHGTFQPHLHSAVE
ncbi:hypothetical protein BLNAU_6006 [Blattamonas nauphoetae]|uniref:Uncharacterized protein n=1 Tax=Blattamonas nauphoetae TaxID=2049346 RepID=A0ABQ9Y5G9_9EUKA|nr:hypothetical protein BLNAU_6006 [Blattamonas nauphoetae]